MHSPYNSEIRTRPFRFYNN